MTEHVIRACSSRKKTLQVDDVTFSSFFDYEMSEQDLEKARRELNEMEGEREDCIQNLRNKLEKDTEFRSRTDDSYLLAFLRFRKFDVEKAYKTIRKGLSVRMDHPNMFTVPSNIERLCNTGFVSWLPYRDEEGRLLLTANFGKWHIPEMTLYEILQLGNAFFEMVSANPHSQVNGFVGIWDFKGLTISHITCGALNPRLLWPLSSYIQECYPNRVKLVLVINCPALFYAAYHTAKFVLKNKIVNRIKILGSDMTALHQYVNPALLPKELGGTLDNEECGITQHVMDNLSYLKNIHSLNTASDSPLH